MACFDQSVFWKMSRVRSELKILLELWKNIHVLIVLPALLRQNQCIVFLLFEALLCVLLCWHAKCIDKYSVNDFLSPTEYDFEVIVRLFLFPLMVMDDSNIRLVEDMFSSTFFIIWSADNWLYAANEMISMIDVMDVFFIVPLFFPATVSRVGDYAPWGLLLSLTFIFILLSFVL